MRDSLNSSAFITLHADLRWLRTCHQFAKEQQSAPKSAVQQSYPPTATTHSSPCCSMHGKLPGLLHTNTVHKSSKMWSVTGVKRASSHWAHKAEWAAFITPSPHLLTQRFLQFLLTHWTRIVEAHLHSWSLYLGTGCGCMLHMKSRSLQLSFPSTFKSASRRDCIAVCAANPFKTPPDSHIKNSSATVDFL